MFIIMYMKLYAFIHASMHTIIARMMNANIVG